MDALKVVAYVVAAILILIAGGGIASSLMGWLSGRSDEEPRD